MCKTSPGVLVGLVNLLFLLLLLMVVVAVCLALNHQEATPGE
jgi:hypothetical protein